MVIGKFGGRTFEVTSGRIFTPRDISLSGELDTSDDDASGKKPATTIKGPGLEKVGLEFRLLAVAGIAIQTEIDAWRSIRDAAIAYPLILFGRAVGLNKYLLKGVSVSDVVGAKVNGQAIMSAATLKLDFEEYAAPGTQKSSSKSSGKKKTAAPGLAGQTVSNPYKAPTSTQKAAAKRTNGGMS